MDFCLSAIGHGIAKAALCSGSPPTSQTTLCGRPTYGLRGFFISVRTCSNVCGTADSDAGQRWVAPGVFRFGFFALGFVASGSGIANSPRRSHSWNEWIEPRTKIHTVRRYRPDFLIGLIRPFLESIRNTKQKIANSFRLPVAAANLKNK